MKATNTATHNVNQLKKSRSKNAFEFEINCPFKGKALLYFLWYHFHLNSSAIEEEFGQCL